MTIVHPADSPFNAPEMARCAANFEPLSPLSLLARAACINGEMPATVHGRRQFTWAQTQNRATRLARALAAGGVQAADVVAVMACNTPEFYECFFAVPMCGAVLNPLNIRLDAAAIAFILRHGEARAIIVDREFAPIIKSALALNGGQKPLLVDINDPEYDGAGDSLGVDYEEFIAAADDSPFPPPADEWQALSLNYTSGTTGNPKGVVYSHRGAWLMAASNVLVWQMPHYARYVWTLPMFHCCGWCFPWVQAAVSGVSVCMRKPTVDNIRRAVTVDDGDWLCGAPIVLNMLVEIRESTPADNLLKFMVAGAPPPSSVLARAAAVGISVMHAYGLTEVYGPATACEWKPAWNSLSPAEQTRRNSRQGIAYHAVEGLAVADAELDANGKLRILPADGDSLGEVMMRGNGVMRGYFKNPAATKKAFAGGWFHSGDLGVMESDNYIRLKDRSKDIIISGGENISSIEVEDVLCRHPSVAVAAVVAKQDEKWGEAPCAFIQLRENKTATAEELIAFCRENLAHFKCPKEVRFADIPRTVTGKIQKFLLREGLQKEGKKS